MNIVQEKNLKIVQKVIYENFGIPLRIRRGSSKSVPRMIQKNCETVLRDRSYELVYQRLGDAGIDRETEKEDREGKKEWDEEKD